MAWFFEPEETVGQQWHRLVGGASSWPHHPEAAVRLDDVRNRLAVMFRALGGAGAVRVAAAGATISGHRLGLRARLGLGAAEKLDIPRFDGATLQLPPVLDLLPDRAGNEALYEWLAAWFALAAEHAPAPADALQADVARLRAARAHTARLLAALPGLRPLHQTLSAALRAGWPRRPLTREEATVEAAVLAALGDAEAAARDPRAAAMLDPSVPLERFRAGRRYRSFLPVPLWGEHTAPEPAQERREAGEAEGAPAAAPPDARRRRACRRQNEQTRRRDPLLLNRFETIIGLAEMVNLNRAVEDDDEEGARKAAGDLDEIAVGVHERRATTRLRMELDLPGEAVATEPLPPEALTYPEWDHTRRAYLRGHCRVIAEPADTPQQGED